ncbi:MAG TPA: hypothetical protein VHF51_02745 [Solirubrobacteraceae bacterium]|jgi:hypothetical protein|nr:hypothetical protein [Solirubrobacteraceae bacterium]
MSDEPPTPDENESDAEQYRILQAKRIIVACERLGYDDPRELGSEQVERVQQEIAANRDTIDATVAQRWPETFGGLE